MSNGSKQLIDSFIDKTLKLEIKDDKNIDKRNSNEIRYSFDLKSFLKVNSYKKLINIKSS